MTTNDECSPFPFRSLAVVAVTAVLAVAPLSRDSQIDLQTFFGPVPPAVGALLVSIAGMGALYLLQTRFGFCVWRGGGLGRFAVAAAWALPFMVVITVLDLTAPFPPDINVALPAALAFYPAMGLNAQLALHVIPFAVLMLAVGPLCSRLSFDARVWIAVGLASTIEAAFQIAGSVTGAATIALAVHVFAFGCVELLLYRRYDFAAMYVFRMTYYAWWHVIWGALRL